MTIYWLKVIACLTMALDHIKYAIPNMTNIITEFGGRISFPLFCFCIVEGYIHTRNLEKYLKRLFMLGVVSQIPFMLFCNLPTLNIIRVNVVFLFCIGLVSLKLFEMKENKFLKTMIIIGTCFIAEMLKMDYGAWGILLIFVFYIFRDNKRKKFIAFAIVVSLKYLIRMWCYKLSLGYILGYWICTLIPIIFILLYNGKEGPKVQKFFYCFYPVHLFVLYVVGEILIYC